MGLLSLLRGLLNKQDKEMKILLLGLDNAGKTTCLKKLADEETRTIMPTQGFNIKEIRQKGFKLTMWDIGGQRSIRPYWGNYFQQANALIFVIDSSERKRLDEVGKTLNELLENDKLAGCPLLVLANKQDIDGAMKCKEIADTLDLSNIISFYSGLAGSSSFSGGFSFLSSDYSWS